MKKLSLFLFVIFILLVALYSFWLKPRYTVPILIYHSINYGEGTFFVTPENFSKQMEYLKKNNYKVITLDELVNSIKGKKSIRKSVVITFDDGYEDNFKYAYPILKKFGFPATVFIVSDFVGKKTLFLTWDEVMAMSRDNISFGGHGRSHIYLAPVTDEKVLWSEISGSKSDIESKGLSVSYFCYPSGGFNPKAKELVIKAGYKGACTTNRGFEKFNSDIYELKRIKVTNFDTTKPFGFRAKLSGYYTIFKKQKSGY